ncbi:VOC family protein [Solihabitans fulvus]|uniref:VOC family protein n=1 Tax=Solihabitans fulvus TaxID=1892852 RepID=A0A5B2XEG9_9PSEU|nr:VOC family protein [Solihabitans fulvus]KAA2261636.1 VOC family protein [Solihabitans fulvus]
MAIGVQVTFDASDPQKLAEFWVLALDYVPDPPPPGFISWGAFATAHGMPRDQWRAAVIDPEGRGPRLLFLPVPEGKTAKNRMHLDVHASAGAPDPVLRRAAVAEHVERLVAAGATRLREVEEEFGYCVVMQDPEGNEFCVT